MRQLSLLLAIFAIATQTLSAQVGQWVDLTEAQTNLLGRPISKVNKGAPIFIPNAEVPELTYEVFDGAGSIDDYKQKFRNFLTGILDIKSYSVKDVQVRQLKYKSIKPQHFYDGLIAPNTRFAYAGQTADTVVIKVRRAKGIDLDFKKLLDTILKRIPTQVAGDVSALVTNLKADIDDSLSTTIKIANPNVFFKARFVEFLNANPPKKRTWDDYWIHFFNNATNLVSEYTTLDISKPQLWRETKRKYVQFWGPNDDPNRLYYFKARKENNEMKLFFCRFTNNQGEVILKEIPYTLNEGKKVWELEYSKVDEFLHRTNTDVTKFVYLGAFAEQINANQVRIHNYDGVVNDKEKIITYVKYPEIKFRYLKQND